MTGGAKKFFGQLGGGGYRADAVQFDGTNDYLTRGAELTGIADGKAGTFSAWIDFTGGDATMQRIFTNGIDDPTNDWGIIVSRPDNNTFQVAAQNSTPGIILQIATVGTFVASTGWVHLLSSWDLGTAGRRHIFINDVSDISVTTFTDDIIDYVRFADWSVGAWTNGNFKMNADIADLWFDDAYIDITVGANRRGFIDPNLNPVNLGEAGQLPTGSAPLIFFSGTGIISPTGWESNKGTGGGFTENGALTAGGSSPSD